jgi:hypothetical protein
MNKREGKSIYNTEFTLSINQHFAFTNLNETTRQRIPIEMGYISHIRDDIESFFAKQKCPLTYFIIDTEYFKFISDFRY